MSKFVEDLITKYTLELEKAEKSLDFYEQELNKKRQQQTEEHQRLEKLDAEPDPNSRAIKICENRIATLDTGIAHLRQNILSLRTEIDSKSSRLFYFEQQQQQQHLIISGNRTAPLVPAGSVPLSVALDCVEKISSPSSHGAALFGRRGIFCQYPISYSLDSSCCMAADFNNVPYIGHHFYGKLKFEEGHYYQSASKPLPSFVEFCNTGNKEAACNAYTDGFCGAVISFSKNFQPEVVSRSRPSYPTFGLEGKSFDRIQIEKLLHYSGIQLAHAHFPTSECKVTRRFHHSPPVAYSLATWGFVGIMVSVEWIGCLYLSFISKPFILESEEHRQAVKMIEDLAVARNSSQCLTDPVDIEQSVLSIPKRGQGIYYFQLKDQYYKLIPVTFMDKSFVHSPATQQYHRGKDTYPKDVGEEGAIVGDWTVPMIYFYHTYTVMKRYQDLWAMGAFESTERDMFVRSSMLYGHFSVLIQSQFVGQRNASDEEMSTPFVVQGLVKAVLWLAKVHGLLYIDLRAPNVRVTTNTDGVIDRLWLIDYDDMVLLPKATGCDAVTVAVLLANSHCKVVFTAYPELANGFRTHQCKCVQCCSERDTQNNLKEMSLGDTC